MKNFFKKLFNKKQYEIEKLEKKLQSEKSWLELGKSSWFGEEDFSEWEEEIAKLEDQLKNLKNEKDNFNH